MILCVFAMLAGCDADTNAQREADSPTNAAATADPAASPGETRLQDDRPTVVFVGDSLTAGYGLGEDQAFPALVAHALADEGTAVRVVNAGVSGDTTAGGLSRIDWLLRQEPTVVVVGLGGNDGLRGLNTDNSYANLEGIITRSQNAGAVVVLLGMLMPPNYGPDYVERFSAIYPALAEKHDVVLMPFALKDVAAIPELNLADGMHPNVEGQRIVARNVTPYVKQALEQAATKANESDAAVDTTAP